MHQGSILHFLFMNGVECMQVKAIRCLALVICSRFNFLLSKSTHNTELQISEWPSNKNN